MTSPPTLAALASLLRARRTSAAALTEAALSRALDPRGEGARTFTFLDQEGARAQARAADALFAAGTDLGALMGIPVSLKDLFDVAGQVTAAGSTILRDAPAAAQDAPVVARLRRAGAVLIGRTNMVEFAYSGLGLNPHFGTPANPWDRATRRVPGGSSSGAAVSVTDGFAAAAIGTDTGGSVRIPAALCGLTGFKPSAARISREGTLPLSFSLDSIGPLAPSVDCCARLDRVIADVPLHEPAPPALKAVRLLSPTNRVAEALDADVARAFDATLQRLSAQGVTIVEQHLAPLEQLYGEINPLGSLSAPEAFAWHRELLARGRDQYDRRVAERIEQGAHMRACDYLKLLALRREFQQAMRACLAGFDALVMPTVAMIAPPIAPLADDDALYWAQNARVLRNTSMVNVLDGCAITLPAHSAGEAPVGFSLARCEGDDATLLALARALEPIVTR